MDYEPVRAGLEQAIPFKHAGGLFSTGEAASSAAFLGAFVERIGDLTPLAKSASIEYLRLAKGPITATATLGEDRAELFERLDADGRIEFPIAISLADEGGTEVATMTVDWHVRRNA